MMPNTNDTKRWSTPNTHHVNRWIAIQKKTHWSLIYCLLFVLTYSTHVCMSVCIKFCFLRKNSSEAFFLPHRFFISFNLILPYLIFFVVIHFILCHTGLKWHRKAKHELLFIKQAILTVCKKTFFFSFFCVFNSSCYRRMYS